MTVLRGFVISALVGLGLAVAYSSADPGPAASPAACDLSVGLPTLFEPMRH
jgi:hypothetical protein